MLKDRAREYFLENDFNCAEAALCAIRDEYGLDIREDDVKLVSAFGGGMGCGKTCGVISGCLAAYGKMVVDGKAHNTKDFSVNCMKLYRAMTNELGNDMCVELKRLYRDPETRCLRNVEVGLDAFEKFIGK